MRPSASLLAAIPVLLATSCTPTSDAPPPYPPQQMGGYYYQAQPMGVAPYGQPPMMMNPPVAQAAATPPAAAAPAVPMWPAHALEAKSIEEFVGAAGPTLKVLAQRAAATCERYAASHNDAELEVSPAQGTWLVGAAKVLEVGAECATVTSNGGGTQSAEVDAFASLNGSIRQKSLFGPPWRTENGLSWRFDSPSTFSDQPDAVDVEVSQPGKGNRQGVAIVTVVLPQCDCRLGGSDGQRGARQAYATKAHASFEKGIVAALANLESSCESTSGVKGLSSPALGTDLATDARVLDVVGSCQLGRARGSAMFATAPLKDGKSPSRDAGEVASGRVGPSVVSVALNRKKRTDPAVIKVVRSTKRRTIHLEVQVKGSSLPAPPK
ncbi:MAG: hypothetical protein HOW73_36460 [Polyangiaceae bacterium]|nr:hypothetical protein [Polyangiaceae bacterium]